MSIEEMMRSWQAPEKPKRILPTCTRERTQYRRLEDEDAGGLDGVHFDDRGEVSLSHYEKTGEVRYRPEPELAGTVALPVVPADVFRDVPEELKALAREYVERFQEPVGRLPLCLSHDSVRAILSCVYHMRHHNRMPLGLRAERPTDSRLPGFDLPDSIDRLTRVFKEEVLARAGHRTAAHGVFPIDPERPEKGWRVQIWDTSKEKKNSNGEVVIGGKLHIAYKKTEEEAWDTLAAWFLKHRGFDVRKFTCIHPDSAMALIARELRDAVWFHNDYREVSVKELWVGTDDEDDWD